MASRRRKIRRKLTRSVQEIPGIRKVEPKKKKKQEKKRKEKRRKSHIQVKVIHILEIYFKTQHCKLIHAYSASVIPKNYLSFGFTVIIFTSYTCSGSRTFLALCPNKSPPKYCNSESKRIDLSFFIQQTSKKRSVTQSTLSAKFF